MTSNITLASVTPVGKLNVVFVVGFHMKWKNFINESLWSSVADWTVDDVN